MYRKCDKCDRMVDVVRAIDIIILGPFMVWFGYMASAMPGWARLFMMLSGAATVAFNWLRYGRP